MAGIDSFFLRHAVKRRTSCKTIGVLRQAEFTWTIPNFAFKCDNQDKPQTFTSVTFHAEGNDDIKWYLVLRLNEKGEDNKIWMSFFLCLTSSSRAPKSPVTFQLSIGDKTHQAASGTSLIEDEVMDQKILPGKGKGFRKYVLRNDVLFGNYLVNGSLTLGCNLQYEQEVEQITAGSCATSHRPSALEDALSRSSFSTELKELLTSTRFSDVCFVVEGQEFLAHKSILSTRSPVFAAMFEHPDMKENQLNRVDIKDIEPEVFKALLHFIYTDQVELKEEEEAKKLLAAANRYLLQLLKCRCEDFLGALLTCRNSASLLMLSDLHNATYLKEMAIGFILRNAGPVMKTDGWKTLKRSHPELCCDVMEEIVNAQK